jgi:hypothetical protein
LGIVQNDHKQRHLMSLELSEVLISTFLCA